MYLRICRTPLGSGCESQTSVDRRPRTITRFWTVVIISPSILDITTCLVHVPCLPIQLLFSTRSSKIVDLGGLVKGLMK